MQQAFRETWPTAQADLMEVAHYHYEVDEIEPPDQDDAYVIEPVALQGTLEERLQGIQDSVNERVDLVESKCDEKLGLIEQEVKRLIAKTSRLP